MLSSEAEARGGFEVRISSNSINTMVGLSTIHLSPTFSDIEFGVLLSSGFSGFVYHRGAFQAAIGSFTPGATLQVVLDKDYYPQVRVDGVLRHQSELQFAAGAVVDVSMFSVGAVLAEFSWVDQQTALCQDIVCSDDKNVACHEGNLCLLGTCVPGQPQREGESCDDRDPRTVNDVCISGVCKGDNLCQNVTCNVIEQCYDTGSCDIFTGQCVFIPLPLNTSCNDGDPATIGDVCDGNGTCAGIDLCEETICPEPTTCTPTVDCFRGICSIGFAEAGTLCFDGNPLTVDDTCDGSGTCVGQDPCIGIQVFVPFCSFAKMCALVILNFVFLTMIGCAVRYWTL